jgi:hypothetical protein
MGSEITESEEFIAKDSLLLVVFGASDDNAELRGIVKDEIGCYDGGEFRVDAKGLRDTWGDDDLLCEADGRAFFEREKLPSVLVKAIWDDDKLPCWTYKTSGENVARFAIMEDGETWCEGVVIDCKHLFTKEN